jgi:hypothetical protein
MNSNQEILGAWPSLNSVAGDLGQRPGTVRMWKARDVIPPEFWEDLVAASIRRGIAGVTLELLARLAARNRRGGGATPKDTVQANA